MQPERNSLSTLNDIETNIRASDAIQADKKSELLHLLSTLKSEIATLEHTHAAHAESVIGLTERSMPVMSMPCAAGARAGGAPREQSAAAIASAMSVDDGMSEWRRRGMPPSLPAPAHVTFDQTLRETPCPRARYFG